MPSKWHWEKTQSVIEVDSMVTFVILHWTKVQSMNLQFLIRHRSKLQFSN